MSEPFAIDTLRQMVSFYDLMNETFNQSFAMSELVKLHAYCMSEAGTKLPECPDTWTENMLRADEEVRR